ncbi:MAG TPA: pentapeptide repeat-containing protein [Gammaproteobacteria bacterium]
MAAKHPNKFIEKGNREVVTDFYVPSDIENVKGELRFKIFIRLNAKGIRFKNVSFMHCVFDGCYMRECVFDSCDFTGCRFVASNFHQTIFAGCDFRYATFDKTLIDSEILESEAPKEENLRMHFSRSLRTNYQQLGDAKSVNKAISIELGATSQYLHKSWASKETYYKEKYGGLLKRGIQLLKWLEFWVLHAIWGNGESIVKLMRSLLIVVAVIAVYDTIKNGDPLDLSQYWGGLLRAPSIFLGVLAPTNFSTVALSAIVGTRFVAFALLTTLLVKRFSRR